jgi:hydroxypyruvate reductase
MKPAMTRPWSPRDAMQALFLAGVDAARARHSLPAHLPQDRPAGQTAMIALGKAAGDMAQVALAQMRVDRGLVVVPAGGLPPGFRPPAHVEVITASHPEPSGDSERAGRAALALAGGLGPQDRLLVLLSGGGSSLMTAPRAPLTLADIIAINAALLRSGAPIGAINRIRRRLCEVKGGGLAAAAAPAEVVTLVLSDVPGDDLALVASGPTVITAESGDWRALARHYGVEVPVLADRPAPEIGGGPHPPRMVASAATALAAMAATARDMGFEPILLGDDLEGDATSLAQQHAALAVRHAAEGARVALLSGGETSVVVGHTAGRGGRNQSYALVLALALRSHPDIHAFAGDSDGIDGNSSLAGAMIFPDTLARCRASGLDPQQSLAACNSAPLFEALGTGFATGPTFTNVNDLRGILVGTPRS